MGPMADPTVKIPDPHQSVTAGRVTQHFSQWKKIGASPWHLQILLHGIPFEWADDPPPFNRPFDSAASLIGRTAVRSLFSGKKGFFSGFTKRQMHIAGPFFHLIQTASTLTKDRTGAVRAARRHTYGSIAPRSAEFNAQEAGRLRPDIVGPQGRTLTRPIGLLILISVSVCAQ